MLTCGNNAHWGFIKRQNIYYTQNQTKLAEKKLIFLFNANFSISFDEIHYNLVK